MKSRTIAVITTSRADYGHLYWPLKALESHSDIHLQLIVTGAHLSAEFGETIQAIRADGFEITETVECLLSSDSDVGMAKTIGVAMLGLADCLGRLRPDLLLLIADRYEMLAPASVALALRIPIAHIEGGDISEGAIDDAVRNALTKMSHLHFTPTEPARRRVIAMGETCWRVHRVGAPSLDHLRHQRLPEKAEVERKLGLNLAHPTIVVAYHPVTLRRNTTEEADAFFAALDECPQQIVFCFPNADAGSRALIQRAETFCEARANATLFVNLDHLTYWRLLHEAALMIGNSSSGIMESPSLALPCVNVGDRQKGRLRAPNIIDTPAEKAAILAAVSKGLSHGFQQSLEGMSNPYGDGRAGERIAEILATTPIDTRLLRKVATPLDAWTTG